MKRLAIVGAFTGRSAVDALMTSFEALVRFKPIAPSPGRIGFSQLPVAGVDFARAKSSACSSICTQIGCTSTVQSEQDEQGSDAVFHPLTVARRRRRDLRRRSDHMVDGTQNTAIKAYNPFLGMWIAVTRKKTRKATLIHPEERISRQEAIKCTRRGRA